MNYLQTCERSRRTAGFPAQLHCRNCGRGPCKLGIGEPEACAVTRDLQYAIPNRLHGAVVNNRGEAI